MVANKISACAWGASQSAIFSHAPWWRSREILAGISCLGSSDCCCSLSHKTFPSRPPCGQHVLYFRYCVASALWVRAKVVGFLLGWHANTPLKCVSVCGYVLLVGWRAAILTRECVLLPCTLWGAVVPVWGESGLYHRGFNQTQWWGDTETAAWWESDTRMVKEHMHLIFHQNDK